MGVLQLSKYDDHAYRLQLIFQKMEQLIKHHTPTDVAIEAPFFGKNVQSMLKLGRAQGVAIAAALSREMPVFEYSPRKIKQSITGNGNASKEQVAAMIQRLLKIEDSQMPEKMDATDGLAAAVCHFYQTSNPLLGTKSNSWKSFLSNNPDRIIGKK
jgi:crossover junction endodeoxyribonuclease RuvC